MAELKFLGTGGAIPTLERGNTSFIIDTGDTRVLVDCPDGVVQKIRRLGYHPNRIETIIITHIHPDHVNGLPGLVHSLVSENRSVDLFGSEESLDFSRRLLDLYGLLEDKVRYRIRFLNAGPGKSRALSPSLAVEFLPVPHHISSRAVRFIIGTKVRLIYSGDTPFFPPLFKWACKADILIHDCSAPSRFFKTDPSLMKMHTSSLELGNHSREAEIKCLIPCHFFGDLDYSLSEMESEIRRRFTGSLIIPEDYSRILLSEGEIRCLGSMSETY